MATLQELNDFSNQTVTFADNRASNVIFNFPNAVDLTDQSITTTSFTLQRTIDIVEIIQPAQALVSFIVDVSALTGATVTFGTLPSGVVVSSSGGVFTVNGIDSISDWEAVRAPTIDIPAGSQGSFEYTCSIKYTASGTRLTKSWTVGTFKSIANLTASSTVSCNTANSITHNATANLITVINVDQAIGETVILARFSVNVTPTLLRDVESTVSITSTLGINAFKLPDYANRFYDFDNEVQYNGQFSSTAQFGEYLSGDDKAIFVSTDGNATANMFHILSPYDPAYWDADPSTVNPDSLSHDGGQYAGYEPQSVLAWNSHEESLGALNILLKGIYAFNFSGHLAVIQHDRQYQANDIERTQAPYGEVNSFDTDFNGGAGFRYDNNGTKTIEPGRYTVAVSYPVQTYDASTDIIPTSTWNTQTNLQVAYIIQGGTAIEVYDLNQVSREVDSSTTYSFARLGSYDWKAIDSDENYWYMTARTNSSGDGAIYMRDMSDGTLTRTITTTGNYWDSLRVAGDFIVVSNSTTTHVYRKSDGTQVQTGLNGGYSLATNGQEVLIGDHTANTNVGEAYLYDIATGTLRKTFSNPNIETGSNADKFGYGVALGLNHVAISAIDEDETGTNEGVVYLYR